MRTKLHTPQCQACVEECPGGTGYNNDRIVDCPGYADDDYEQVCSCSHCENWDDPECWIVRIDSHNERAHSAAECSILSHKQENDIRLHNRNMQEALAAGKTALLI